MTTYLIGEAMTETPSLDLVAIADRYRRALDAKPSKGDISPDGIAAITDSVADVPDLIAELLLTTRLEHEHTWLGPWVGVAGNRIYTCAEAGCVAVRSEGGPDQPEPVKPSREAVRQAIEAAFGPTWDSAVEQGLDAAADAVLALLPGRCAPTEEEIARRLHRADCDCPEPGAEDHGMDYAMLAEDVLALFAAQPTVAKAKAEGWDEGWVSATVAMAEGTPANPYRSEADHG